MSGGTVTVHIKYRCFISIATLLIFSLAAGMIFQPAVFVEYTKLLRPDDREREEDAVKAAVVLYNRLYADLYASDGRTIRLDEFPGVKLLRHEIYRDLDYLRAKKGLLVYDMASITFLEIKMPVPSTAEVTAFEEWNYVYQDPVSREPLQPLKGMGEGFKYRMQKQDRQWVVLDAVHVHVSEPERKEGFYY